MDGFVSLINALAWPSATLAIAFLFRREFRASLGRLGQVKYGGMEVTFREDLHKAETLARAASSVALPAPTKVSLEVASGDASELAGTLVGQGTSTSTTVLMASGARSDRPAPRNLESFLRICEGSPRDGVLETWDELSRALVHASTVLGDRRNPAPVRVDAALRFLVDRGWLNSVEGQLVERLRSLSVHVERRDGPPVLPDDARRFVELAVPMIDRVVALG